MWRLCIISIASDDIITVTEIYHLKKHTYLIQTHSSDHVLSWAVKVIGAESSIGWMIRPRTITIQSRAKDQSYCSSSYWNWISRFVFSTVEKKVTGKVLACVEFGNSRPRLTLSDPFATSCNWFCDSGPISVIWVNNWRVGTPSWKSYTDNNEHANTDLSTLRLMTCTCISLAKRTERSVGDCTQIMPPDLLPLILTSSFDNDDVCVSNRHLHLIQ